MPQRGSLCGLAVLVDDGRAMLVKPRFVAELAEKDAFLRRRAIVEPTPTLTPTPTPTNTPTLINDISIYIYMYIYSHFSCFRDCIDYCNDKVSFFNYDYDIIIIIIIL